MSDVSEPVEEVVKVEAPAEPADWKSALPEDLRENPNFTKYTSMESFAKGHINAVSQLGKDSIQMPQSEDEWADTYSKLGRPDNAAGYELAEFEGPDNLREYVEGRVDSYKDIAHQLGLSNGQAQALHQWYMEGNAETARAGEEATKAQMEDAFSQLQHEWGRAYETNLNVAKTALGEFGSEELVHYLEESGLGNHPDMIKMFQNIGKSMLGDTQLEGKGGGEVTPDQAQATIQEIMARPEYWDSNNLERPALVRQVAKLMEQVHPEG